MVEGMILLEAKNQDHELRLCIMSHIGDELGGEGEGGGGRVGGGSEGGGSEGRGG